MTSMGQVTLSSFPDIAMGVFTSGVGPYVSSIYRYSRHVVQRMMSDASPDERYFMMDMTHSLEANATGLATLTLLAGLPSCFLATAQSPFVARSWSNLFRLAKGLACAR